jgi:hypothetical protein
MECLDFNTAAEQQYGELIPAGTACKVMMNVRPGQAGPEGWLTPSQTSNVLLLNAEFTILEGPFARRKFWQNLPFSGGQLNAKGESKSGEITRTALRAMIESSRNIHPYDMSDSAMNARRVQSFKVFDGIVFAAVVGIKKGDKGYPDRNTLQSVITPKHKEYGAIMSGNAACTPPAGGSSAFSWVDTAVTDGPPQQGGSQAWAGGSQQQQTAAHENGERQAPPSRSTTPSWAARS